MGALAAAGLTAGTTLGSWRLERPIGPSSWSAVDAEGAAVVVRVGPAGAVAAEVGALSATGQRPVRGLPRLAGVVDGDGPVAVAVHAVEGPTVADLLAAGTALDWPQVAAALAPVADGLQALHDAGWVHGDVAPGNVVLAPCGGVLVDLGCARPAADAGATGTPGSVAPEVEAGAAVSPAAEVWSLAALAAALARPGPHVTLALRRALARDPAARPTAAAFAAALRLAAVDAEPLGLDVPTGQGTVGAATTRTYGPRPPAAAPGPVPAPAGRGALVGVVAAVAAAAVAVPVTAAVAADGPSPQSTRRCQHDAGPLAADPDGDGCAVGATWADGVLTIALDPGGPPVRVAVGAPGDVVVLGDWDCDGRDTPAAYRPATGAVTAWDRWPVPGAGVAPSTVRLAAPGGRARVERGGDGCDRVVVGSAR